MEECQVLTTAAVVTMEPFVRPVIRYMYDMPVINSQPSGNASGSQAGTNTSEQYSWIESFSLDEGAMKQNQNNATKGKCCFCLF